MVSYEIAEKLKAINKNNNTSDNRIFVVSKFCLAYLQLYGAGANIAFVYENRPQVQYTNLLTTGPFTSNNDYD